VTLRLLIAAEQPMLRAGYRRVLAGEPDLTVVGEAGDGPQAVDLTRRLLPDVVLMAAALPRTDGPTTARAIHAARLPVRVLMLTQIDSDDSVIAALRAGALGVLSADPEPAELLRAVRSVATGEAVLAARALTRLLRRFAEGTPGPEPEPAPAPALAALTDRERQVLVEVARGRSNAEIAAALSVSETTVKTHVGHVLAKLGLRDRAQAVVAAYECGLVRPGRISG
jgi:DNA-binding NarL/FixJ family response regulator